MSRPSCPQSGTLSAAEKERYYPEFQRTVTGIAQLRESLSPNTPRTGELSRTIARASDDISGFSCPQSGTFLAAERERYYPEFQETVTGITPRTGELSRTIVKASEDISISPSGEVVYDIGRGSFRYLEPNDMN